MNREMVDLLLPPTAAVNGHGQTPLSLACANGHLNVTKYLVEERHCDPNGMYVCMKNNSSPGTHNLLLLIQIRFSI